MFSQRTFEQHLDRERQRIQTAQSQFRELVQSINFDIAGGGGERSFGPKRIESGNSCVAANNQRKEILTTVGSDER